MSTLTAWLTISRNTGDGQPERPGQPGSDRLPVQQPEPDGGPEEVRLRPVHYQHPRLRHTYADQLIEQSHGDVRVLEAFLGLDSGALGENPYRVDFPNPIGLHMATGNESGANQKWIAGGFTKSSFRGTGVPEAVIDPAPEGTYTGRPVWRK